MKELSAYYMTRTTQDLKVLRSKKVVEIQKIEATRNNFWSDMETRKLKRQIGWIDAVLLSREQQMPLL